MPFRIMYGDRRTMSTLRLNESVEAAKVLIELLELRFGYIFLPARG